MRCISEKKVVFLCNYFMCGWIGSSVSLLISALPGEDNHVDARDTRSGLRHDNLPSSTKKNLVREQNSFSSHIKTRRAGNV